ncbi:unnamed protein product [Urochloa humidicola]
MLPHRFFSRPRRRPSPLTRHHPPAPLDSFPSPSSARDTAHCCSSSPLPRRLPTTSHCCSSSPLLLHQQHYCIWVASFVTSHHRSILGAPRWGWRWSLLKLLVKLQLLSICFNFNEWLTHTN